MIGITWPVPPEVDDAELERRLFTSAGFYKAPTRVTPDWNRVHVELRRRGVTLLLLWEEYRAEHLDGYGYSRFCDLYIAWRRGVSATMRQTHVAGEKLFVDYAGDTVPVFDGATGEERRAHVFVAVLGASNYTYAEARWSEGLADWIGSHVNALTFLGGVFYSTKMLDPTWRAVASANPILYMVEGLRYGLLGGPDWWLPWVGLAVTLPLALVSLVLVWWMLATGYKLRG